MKKLLVLLIIATAWWSARAAVTCTAAGRFAETDDTTCQNYTLCVYDTATATYVAYNYTCPTTSVFNPNTAQCTASTNYVCNNTASDNATSICTADGYIANPNSTDCTGYVECVEINGTYTETDYACPNGTYFNPNTTNCETDYNCTSATFTCTAAGRFADDSVAGCQDYFLCVEVSTGTYAQYNYTCPTTSVFNPNTAVCTTSYTCTT